MRNILRTMTVLILCQCISAYAGGMVDQNPWNSYASEFSKNKQLMNKVKSAMTEIEKLLASKDKSKAETAIVHAKKLFSDTTNPMVKFASMLMLAEIHKQLGQLEAYESALKNIVKTGHDVEGKARFKLAEHCISIKKPERARKVLAFMEMERDLFGRNHHEFTFHIDGLKAMLQSGKKPSK